ncbi:hypothetical protein [Pinibacter soli]|uniref:Uncharacterized protein n=1 Tax=Pinibacter soli TaxID=3044211 RepID=A0ABT6RH31_9BACT|nr:hypothetical protein [Pinibacter soli]MDI3321865.1 hypothetical protein [Pinibacter soli]
MKYLLKYPSWLLCAATLSIALFSCQKNADDTIPESSKLSSKDPQALSAAITVWHGKRTTGAMPASSNTTDIKLGTPNESSVNAIAGRHAFIHTNIESGDVAGYYVQINGASEYFKVDYAKPVVQSSTQQGSISTASVHPFGKPAESTNLHRSLISVMGGSDNNNDSLIVINIPVNIKTPDTVCVTYMAYDFNNHVSNPVTTCIYIDHFGGDDGSKWLEGTWTTTRLERSEIGQLKDYFNYTYNKWIVDREEALWAIDFSPAKVYQSGDSAIYIQSYSGTVGAWYMVMKSSTDYYSINGVYTPRPTDILLGTDSINYKKNNITLNSDKYIGEYSDATKSIYWSSNGPSLREFSHNSLNNGSWSYDSKTKKIIIISEYSDDGNGPTLDPYMQEASLEKVSDNQFKISYNDVANDGKTYTYTGIYQRQ